MTSSQRTRRATSLTVSGSGVAVYPPGATFGPRRLHDFEFVWLLQGAAEWRYDQGSITLGPNSLLLARPGIRDSFIWDRTRPTRHAYPHFQLIGQLWELPDPVQWPLVRTLPDDDPLRLLLRDLLNLNNQPSGTLQQTAQEVLRLLLTLFVQGPVPDGDGAPLPAHLDTLLEFVRAAWSPPAATSASPRSPTTAVLPTPTTSRAASTGSTVSRPDATAAPHGARSRPSRSLEPGCSLSAAASGGRPDEDATEGLMAAATP